jgi:hypothetical protein
LVTGVNPDPATGNGGNAPGTQRPNQLIGDVTAPNRLQPCAASPFCLQWLNTSPGTFANPAAGTYGNMGVGSVLGPGYWEWDQSISRQFTIHEGQRLEIRGEAFNLTNTLRPGNPGIAVGAANTFGLIQTNATPAGPTTAPARVMQFALKYVF